MSEENSTKENQVDKAVAEGGVYELIRQRLVDQGSTLKEKIKSLNQQRTDEFGASDMSVNTRIRVRTDNNCIPRDIVQVGDELVFGYNVFIGLKNETKIHDVFAIFKLVDDGSAVNIEEANVNDSFLAEQRFVDDFNELYRYYKNTRLVQLLVKEGKLLAAFQIGERLDDLRVFRWSVSVDAKVIKYIDNRGERDIKLPPKYDFEWEKTQRENTVNGRHPHVNICDKVFVETVNGSLTVKIENNTEDGLGIYSEKVEDQTQSLDDAEFHYAEVGSLILLKILPYREEHWRFFIFNTLTEEVLKMDAIGSSCVQLPENHGIVFPGGYYLQTGDYKTFDDEARSMNFKRAIRSPNGEDVLYVFYERETGMVGLLAYNVIEKSMQNPIYGDGYALADNGRLVIFAAQTDATRVHPMQIWETPFYSDEYAHAQPEGHSFLARIGNIELVRGISDLFGITRIIDNQRVSAKLYEELNRSAKKLFDHYHWLDSPELSSLGDSVKEVAGTAELVIDEFDKVESIRKQSTAALRQAQEEHKAFTSQINHSSWDAVDQFIDSLANLRRQRGHIASLKELRYIDLAALDTMDENLVGAQDRLSSDTVSFLSKKEALAPYQEKIKQFDKDIVDAQGTVEIKPLIDNIEHTTAGLDLLSELMSTLKIRDPKKRTDIIDAISEIYALLNQNKANAKIKQKSFGSAEAVAQFSAQFKLLSQSIANALGLSNTPESCDEQMSRLLVQLEELEGQFADHDEFLTDIVSKRDEIYEAFESHKQSLIDERQRKAQSLADAAMRLLTSIDRRSEKFDDSDALNTYFGSDALVAKVRELIEQLHHLDAAVIADGTEAKLKAIREQAVRNLRDKSDIYEEGGSVIKLGPRHKFSVNTQALDLSLIAREGSMYTHLSGTDFFERIDNETLAHLKPYWNVNLESESDKVCRAEYLASSLLHDSQHGVIELTLSELKQALSEKNRLIKFVREYAAPRYKEGYEKGIHDHDAALILQQLVPAIERADLLIFDPQTRALAQVFWANIEQIAYSLKRCRVSYETWRERACSALQMQSVFSSGDAASLVAEEIRLALHEFIENHPIPVSELQIRQSADYLVAELGRERIEFIGSKYAKKLADELKRSLDDNTWRRYRASLEKMLGWPGERWSLSVAWLEALVKNKNLEHLEAYIPEAAALINADERLDRRVTEVDLEIKVEGLLSEHALIKGRCLTFSLDQFVAKLDEHREEFIPNYRKFLEVRHTIIERERDALRLEEYKPRPLSSFVRNQLINEAYLPVIGDNLAKQMGTVGDSKRTDLMGLLMMISPPGYGKTTLMEYTANRLGLIFMKINCPSLGHDVDSLDPAQAPNATARQELIKINLALEMGNNTMLYLDDIQHTNPEFLQKFISLCDGTRRMEGVWKNKTKTYDLRGKKFCVVMAGNPYTESGELFKIPDMLANRADIYNLGDVLGGKDAQFALSYIENSLTSNKVLAPLATREQEDVYKLVRWAQGENIASTDLSYQYSAAEINEIKDVLQKMFTIRDVVLKVNMEYIRSAAQAEKYRTEPAFKLQGSYRNMNKMAEKINAVMNEEELQQLISDHYLGEAQLLTTGAEENLLKLKELLGHLSAEESARWSHIKEEFQRNQAMGGDDTDSGTQIVGQLLDLNQSLSLLGSLAQQNLSQQQTHNSQRITLKKEQFKLDKAEHIRELKRAQELANNTEEPIITQADILDKVSDIMTNSKPHVEVINQPVPGLGKLLETLTHSIETSLYPIVHSMEKKLEIDLRTHYKMEDISEQLREVERTIQLDLAKKRHNGNE